MPTASMFSLTRSTFGQTSWRWLTPIFALAAFSLVAWLALWSVNSTLKGEIEASLVTILKADVKAMTIWLESEQASVVAITRQPSTRDLLVRLVEDSRQAQDDQLLDLADTQALQAALQPAADARSALMFLVSDQSGRTVASSSHLALGSRIPADYDPVFDKILADQSVVIPPHRSRFPVPDSTGRVKTGVPIMLVASPIKNEMDKIVGSLSLILSPSRQFTEVLGVARSGKSGETYAVDASALLLSESRFEEQLRTIDLLGTNEQSSLRIAIRNPGGNMTTGFRPQLAPQAQPMTVSAAALSVAASNSDASIGSRVEPFADYRGVPVVGAWQWLPQYQFGIITEVDYEEVYAPAQKLKTILWSLMGLLAAALAGVVIYSSLIQKAWRRLRRVEHRLEQLGQYELLDKVGEGGMGEVYRARHAMLRRDTAVKLLRTNLADQTSIARFEREVQATSQLNNPNTIQIYDYGRTPEGTFYYAMEMLHGINLRELVRDFGPLPDGRTRFILEQVCWSLAEAHAAGLIHRDVKPANIMLTRRGGLSDSVKVLDFGLVRSLAADNHATLTMDGSVAGTPAYMSPEAAQARSTVDARSDIYALGCTSFFLLAGHPPFAGDNPIDTCWKQVREPPPELASCVPQPISVELTQLTMRCLAKEPDERPQSVLEMLDALESMSVLSHWTHKDAQLWWDEHADRVQSANSRETHSSANTDQRYSTTLQSSAPLPPKP